MTPVDSKILDYIDRLKLGRRKDEPPPVTDGRRKEQLAKVRTETDKLWERKVTFLGGATARESFLPEDLPEIAFIGRSNVGKSSLINALTAQGKVRVSDTPGETQQINWYRVGKHLTLIDLPGYGFAFAAEEKVKAWTELMCEFLTSRKSLKRICVLIDARHGFKPADLDFIDMLEKAKRKYQIVMTKADLVTPPDLARRYHLVQQAMKRRRHGLERILMVSSWNATGLSAMRTELTNLMVGAREAPPATKPEHQPTSLLPDYEAYEPSEERPSQQKRSPSRERRSTQPTGYNRAAGSGGASRGRGRGGGKGPQERSARGGESTSRYNRSSGSPTASRGTRGGRGRGGMRR